MHFLCSLVAFDCEEIKGFTYFLLTCLFTCLQDLQL